MRKIKIYIATSLNGKIARANGAVDWLDTINHPKGEDYGYGEFYSNIDATIMGNNTYKEILGFGVDFPYKGKSNYVLTRDRNLSSDENITYIADDPITFLRNLKKESGRDIWLIGGGQLNTLLLNEGLVDEIIMHIMPIIIPDGITLFEGNPIEQQVEFLSSKSYSSGVMELRYSVK